MNTDNAHFGVVPCEIMVHIFDRLSHRDRKRARRVCQRWNQILDNYPKYFIFRAKWNNRSLKSVLNTYLSVDRLTLLNLTKRIPKNPLPDIRGAILGWRNSQANVANFLRRCQKAGAEAVAITKLSLGEISSKALRKTLSGIAWNSLGELKINVTLTRYKFRRVKTHLENCILLLKLVQVPSVREFHFGFEVKYKCNDYKKREIRLFQKLCLALYEFLSRNANSIKILNCSFESVRRPKFNLPPVPHHLKDSIMNRLDLKNCTMKFTRIGEIENLFSPIIFGSKIQTTELDILQHIRRHDLLSFTISYLDEN